MGNNEKKSDNDNDIKNAWKYTKHASGLYMGNVHFFLVAESMLLLSFVTSDSKPIQLAIALVGISITLYWFYENARLSLRIKYMTKNYLDKAPIYNDYNFSVGFISGRCIIAFCLPITMMLLWIFLLLYTFNNNQLDCVVISVWTVLFVVIVVISMFFDKIIQNNKDC